MSNTIYTLILPIISQDNNKFNFVYQITELSTNIKYIGSKGTKESNVLKALKKYKSSTRNSCFKLNQQLNPLNYHYEILSYHKTRKEATLEEARLHELYDVKRNLKYFNRSNQTVNGFNTGGKTTVKDKDNNTFMVDIDDPRYLSGELVGATKGYMTIKNKNGISQYIHISEIQNESIIFSKNKVSAIDGFGNYLQVDINDPRLNSGELYGCTKGKVPVKDKYGNTSQVAVDDPRYLSGELKHISKGIKLTEEHKKKISIKSAGQNNGFYGKKHSEELINKLSNFYSIEGKEYRGAKLVAQEYNITTGTVKNRCKSNTEKWKDWILIKKRD